MFGGSFGLFVVLSLAIITTSQSIRCPCIHCGNGNAHCASRKYTDVPGPFPKDIKLINMQNNLIETVTKDSFGELPELEVLRLDQNKIDDIRPGAFNKMPKLQELILIKNEIKAVPEDLIHPDAPLGRGIKLNNNGLTYFPFFLLKKTRKIINVMNNPINCNCFSVIPDALKAKVIGVCHSPHALKGRLISSITFEDVNCRICDGMNCNHGSCYSLDNKTRQCLCELNYKGKDCSERIQTGLKATTTSSPTISTTTKSPKPASSTVKITNKTPTISPKSTVETTKKPSKSTTSTEQASSTNKKLVSSTTTTTQPSKKSTQESTPTTKSSTKAKVSTVVQPATKSPKASTSEKLPTTTSQPTTVSTKRNVKSSTVASTKSRSSPTTESTTESKQTPSGTPSSSVTPTQKNIVSM